MKNKANNSKFLKERIPLYYYLFRNKSTPKLAKGLIVGLILYILSPLDFIPDTIPIMGIADDIAVIPLVGLIISKLVPLDIWNESKEKTKRLWFNSKKYKTYKIIFIVIILLLLIFIFKNLFSK